MKTLRLLLAVILASIALVFTASCTKTPAPEPFTAQLENIDGAMAFYSLQHPSLVFQSINKLAAEIPEAAYLNVFLAVYIDQLGGKSGDYRFDEIADGTNIGIYQPVMSLDELKQGKKPANIIFIKLKEGGKIWNLLVKRGHLQPKKIGDWIMFARDAADFDAVKNPDAVIARLSAPQAETLRAWFALDGETTDAYKTLLHEAVGHALIQSKLPDEEKAAFNAYAHILLGDFFDSTHSGHATLNLGDTGLTIAFGTQFKPDTPIGTFLRYRSDATPDIGRYIANDALLTATLRYTPKAHQDLTDHLTDLLLKVDYPPISDAIAKFKQEESDNHWELRGDGCAAMAMNIKIDLTNPRLPKHEDDSFTAHSGKFDEQSLKRTQALLDTVQKIAAHILTVAIATQYGDKYAPQLTLANTPAALTVEGTPFDALTISITPASPAKTAIPPRAIYIGVADGNLVASGNEATLKKRLPALLAKKPLPDNVATANPLQPYDLMSMSVNGRALIDTICDTVKINETDTDAQAALADIKESYKQSGPARITVEARQAALTYKADIPYKFIAASVQLVRYVYSVKNTTED